MGIPENLQVDNERAFFGSPAYPRGMRPLTRLCLRYGVNLRFIRRDCRLNILGEMFSAPPETQYEYVVATVDVKDQKLKLFPDTVQVEKYKYQLR